MGGTRQNRAAEKREYSPGAIREAITNAICHRDYETTGKLQIRIFDNRMEFYNPGGLPEEITPENITQKQFSRNPAIAKVLSKIGYIEEMGEGWDKIFEEHKNHPLKPEIPAIDADRYTMTVTLFSTRQKFGKDKAIELNERQKAALEYVRAHGRITNREYQKLCPDVSRETLRKYLNELIEKKIILMKGVKKGVYYELA
ncbi:MAG: ATP-binding protein [archaeon]